MDFNEGPLTTLGKKTQLTFARSARTPQKAQALFNRQAAQGETPAEGLSIAEEDAPVATPGGIQITVDGIHC